MKRNNSLSLTVMGALGFTAIALLGAGCASTPLTTKTSSAGPPPGNKSGAQLWAQNCGHCHNVRSPDSFSDAQWDVAVLHMRVRGNLTAEEHRSILAFLKSAH